MKNQDNLTENIKMSNLHCTVSELESSFQLSVDQVSSSAAVLLTGQSHDHMLPLLKVNIDNFE